MTMEIMTHLKGVKKTRRTSLVITVACIAISELTAGRRRNLMIKRSRTIIKMIVKATLQGKVCITFSYALNLYLLPLFQIVGLSILVLHHILLEIINLLLPCKQFQEEIDMST